MRERILLAVDDTEASARAVEYVAEVIGGRPDSFVHLIHVLQGEEEVAGARDLLEALRAQLVASGIADDHVDAGTLSVPAKDDLVEGLLEAARDQECSTIAVGRSSLKWFREAFHDHHADELVKRARGFTVWVVE
jgi:K+-sensing histidine kinase KdpD